MKHPKKRTLALALTLAMSLTVPALAAEDTAETADPVEAALAAAETYGATTSIQYALWKDGEIVSTGGSGVYSKTENRALTDDILYGVGSVSKIYTTVAVLQLAEKHRLSLDAPVTRYLKDFKMADPRYKDITVRMLLNHSSGIMGTGLGGAMLFGEADTSATDGLLESLSTQRLVADPGAYSVYCNDGFTLAELVVAAVSGLDFMDYVDKYILDPIGLDDTFAPGGDFDVSRLAKTYRGDDTRALPADSLNAIGAGGIYATASDLAAFGGALTGTELLSQSSLDAMAYPEYSRGIWPEDTLDSLAYGLGWDNMEWYPFCQSDIQALVKGGDTLYYHAGLVVLPEHDMAAAVVSSGGVSTYNEMVANQLLIAALAKEGVSVDESIPALPAAEPAAMPADLLKNAGYYGSTSAQYQVSLTEDGKLTMHYLNYPTTIPDQTFTYHSDGTFRDATGTAYMSFVKEENGQVYLYQKTVSGLPGLGALPVSNYAAVKLPDNPLTPEVQAAWDDILTMGVLPMDEPYNSQTYAALADSAAGETPELVPGYMGSMRIVDAATALFEIQLPGVGGRDGLDYHVEDRDGVTWIIARGSAYMDASAVPELFTGSGTAYTTVQEDGYARWYTVSDNAAGKTMTVQLPKDAGFWVYDAAGQVTASSVLWNDTSVVLPEDGVLVFAGDPGARFHLSFA
ncbi:serine hydrolase [Pusillibacter faecalis]|uniref:Serine hydrolase n=1 Tax=Pusillibacter faecalis TaxID=2714358 RepID=A0A810Q960_9FIRM|nr:serine hydrolase domain-containing protein [Pusillibacter faecalis]BCK84789.1 serine hydrolase [Pusillibacter faecalis]